MYGDKEKVKDLLLRKTCSNCGNALRSDDKLYCNFDGKRFLGNVKISDVLREVDENHTCPLWASKKF